MKGKRKEKFVDDVDDNIADPEGGGITPIAAPRPLEPPLLYILLFCYSNIKIFL